MVVHANAGQLEDGRDEQFPFFSFFLLALVPTIKDNPNVCSL